MKSKNYLEFSLFIVFIISFIVFLMNAHSIFSSISDLVFQEPQEPESFYNSVLMAKRNLFTSVPMFLITLGTMFTSLKFALKERKKDKLVEVEPEI